MNLIIFPQGFVIMVTLIREAVDDVRRWQRDKEVNQQKYKKLTPQGAQRTITSANIRVGDLIFVEKVRCLACVVL